MPDNQYRQPRKKPSAPAPPVNALKNPAVKANEQKSTSVHLRTPEKKRPKIERSVYDEIAARKKREKAVRINDDEDMKIVDKKPKNSDEDMKVYVKGSGKKAAQTKPRRQNAGKPEASVPENYDVDGMIRTESRVGLWVAAIILLGTLCAVAAVAYLTVNGYFDGIISAL